MAWRQVPPSTPVIAAGSTGSIPATADLLGVVARLSRGAVVLPGFDRRIDDETRRALEALGLRLWTGPAQTRPVEPVETVDLDAIIDAARKPRR